MAGVERTATRITGFKSAEMDFQLMRLLGAAGTGGSTAGEVFAARAHMVNNDPREWPGAFSSLADRLVKMADQNVKQGHLPAAASALLRAANYYRSSEYYSDPYGDEALRFGQESRNAFIRAAGMLAHHIAAVDIPFEGHDLPGYFMQPVSGSADGRTVIIMTGFDGTGEELYFQSAADALSRGYNVLIAEGPGQVGCLRRYPRLLFRPDYEKPISAVIDYAVRHQKVAPERLALYGISYGGYFASRAAAHDQRIRALIVNSPIIDLGAYMRGFAHLESDEVPPDEDVSLAEVDEVPEQYMTQEIKLAFKSACRRFGVERFSEWIDVLRDYRVENLAAIQCPSLALVGAGEGDEAFRQHERFRQAVSGPVTSRIFEPEEGADMHCQLGNLPLSNAVIYNWLDNIFGE
ncbi:MAG: dipeptidyl aminopeptidase [Pusillimonas sp.]|nr:dipeptidyl aminopeptidase [Pusillimonas sp.]|tara:strand:- start:8582 stop:9802 length:1221 start_codon:yes stop_codon:yes gene_type:complete